RRHTKVSRDWSSDVCSSDLEKLEPTISAPRRLVPTRVAPMKLAPLKVAPDRLRPDSSQRLQEPPSETMRATSRSWIDRRTSAARSEERRAGKGSKATGGAAS